MSIFVAPHNMVGDANTVTMTPSAETLFPKSYLYDGDPGLPAVFGSLTANPEVVVDLSIMTGGGFEGASLTADGWTSILTGSATAAKSTAQAQFGSASALLTAGSGVAQIYKDVTMRAGWVYRVPTMAARSTSGTPTGKVYLQNLQTGLFWTGAAWAASGAWLSAAAATDWTTWLGAAGVTNASVTIPSFLSSLGATVTCRLTLETSAGGTAIYWDDVDPCPEWDFVSVHGHNFDSLMVITVKSTNLDGSYKTTEATMSVLQPSFYARLSSPSGKRFMKLLATGTPTAKNYIGELWVSKAVALTSGADFGMSVNFHWPQLRNVTRGGTQRVYAQALKPLRTLQLTHRHSVPSTTGSEATVTAARLAAYQQVRDGIYLTSRGGADSVVMVTPALDAEVCILGHLDPDLPTAYWDQTTDVRQTSLRLVEDAFPIVTS